jgi:hypothetical protein
MKENLHENLTSYLTSDIESCDDADVERRGTWILAGCTSDLENKLTNSMEQSFLRR